VGIDYGWQPVADGGFEYIIQIEPETLDSLKKGQDIFSQLPPKLRGIRAYRITVGTGPLPHEGEPPPESLTHATETEPRARSPGAADKAAPGAIQPEPDSQPLAAQKTGYEQHGPEAVSPKVDMRDPAANNDGGSPSDLLPRGFDASGDAPRQQAWVPLTAALVALFVSLGVNFFLGWTTVAQRGRYRSVVARLAPR
jgi:hypothetical protein